MIKIFKGVAAGTSSGDEYHSVKIDGVEQDGNIDFVKAYDKKITTGDTITSVFIYNNKLYVGYNSVVTSDGGSEYTFTNFYYFENGIWKRDESISIYRYDGIYDVNVVDNKLVLLGQYSNYNNTDFKTQVYSSNVNNAQFNMPYEYDIQSSVVYNNELHIIGSNNENDRKKHYKLSMNGSDIAYWGWSQVDTLPFNMISDNSVVAMSDGIHAFVTILHYIWTPTNGWVQQSDRVPSSFVDGVAIKYNNEIHLLDGSTSSNHHYVFKNGSWQTLTDLPCSVKHAIVYKGMLLIFDNDGSKKIYRYNNSSDNWTELKFACYTPREA